MVNTDNSKEHAIKAVKKLKRALIHLDSELVESELDQFISKSILPEIVKEDAISGCSIFEKLEVNKAVFIDSITIQKVGGIESAISSMGMTGICWLMDHIYSVKKLITNYEKLNHETLKNSLTYNLEYLNSLLLSEFYERGQWYENEIKAIRKESAI